ncbi:MAG: hypothetical protein ACM31L_00385 [Actinomycetota bacterium]
MVVRVTAGSKLLALIVPADHRPPGVHFVTNDEDSQQVAVMRHPAGHQIKAHVHNPVPRQFKYTKEVLIIEKGRMRADFYDNDQTYVESREVGPGDVLVLIDGGHGFTVLDEIQMIEVKQGPYVGGADKTLFPPVAAESVTLRR